MIAELVTFKFHHAWSREQESDAVRTVLPKWSANKELLRKHFLWGLGESAGTGAGFYLWPSIEAAQRAHNDEWRAAVIKRTGGEPEIRYFDLLALVDNTNGVVTEWDANGTAIERTTT